MTAKKAPVAKAAPKAAVKRDVRTVCVHRNAAGTYDCKLPRNLSKAGKESGRMCTKHEMAWRAAAKLRYAAAHPAIAKVAKTPAKSNARKADAKPKAGRLHLVVAPTAAKMQPPVARVPVAPEAPVSIAAFVGPDAIAVE